METSTTWHPPSLRDARWSALCRDVATREVLLERDSDRVLRTASVGKLFVLRHAAELHAAGRLDLEEPLDRDAVAPVADSGLWQHLAVRRLPLDDVARLVGSVSDNLATNVLLERLTLTAVQETASRLTADAMLHDVVRDQRSPGQPATLSTGSARAWVDLLGHWSREAADPASAGAVVLGWLAAATDLSLAAAAFDLDPLAHTDPDLGIRLWCKTGSEAGVRADVGLVEAGDRRLAYAVVVNWDDAGDPGQRRAALVGVRDFGERVRAALLPAG